ncbi:MAG: CAP domain-containing protein [Hyphomicrobiales bacterium]|nr:CAP domain-containing protein [Hyphomicrobiales bacterium]MCP4997760.1 CAP domain-containing protein [Hyphomicrobiales bacterium]
MIQRRDLLITGGSTAIAIAACGLFATPANAARGSIVTAKAIGPLNAYRSANGRGALAGDAALGRAALEHSKAMAQAGRLNHNRFRARLRSHGIAGAAAENVAMGQPNLTSVIASWQNSRGHRRNMLGKFSRVGVATARDPASGNRPYWTMILSR